MILKVKKKLFGWSIIDEKHAIVCKIKNKSLLNKSKNIIDKDGKVIFTSDIINLPNDKREWNCSNYRRYVIYKEEKEFMIATFSYAKNPERTLIQKLILKVPQVDEMDIKTPYGLLKVKRQKDNSIIINQGEKNIGKVTSCLPYGSKYIYYLDGYEPIYLASLYILIDYMMNEYDLINI